jgi:hypothetical protein
MIALYYLIKNIIFVVIAHSYYFDYWSNLTISTIAHNSFHYQKNFSTFQSTNSLTMYNNNSRSNRPSAKGGRRSRPSTTPQATRKLISPEGNITPTPPRHKTDSKVTPPATVHAFNLSTFEATLRRAGLSAPANQVARSVHIMGLPNNSEEAKSLLASCSTRLEKGGVYLNLAAMDDPTSLLYQAFEDLTPTNGMKVGAIGSHAKAPAFIVPLEQAMAISYNLSTPNSTSLPPTITFDIPAFVKEGAKRDRVQHITICCTMLTPAASQSLQFNYNASIVKGDRWTHILNIISLNALMDAAHGAIISDTMAIMMTNMSPTQQAHLKDNVMVLPYDPSFVEDIEQDLDVFPTTFQDIKAKSLAVYFRTDPENPARYSLMESGMGALLDNTQATTRLVQMQGVTLLLAQPEDELNPIQLSTSRIPPRMLKLRSHLYIMAIRDLHDWITPCHLLLILTHALGVTPASIITILARTTRMNYQSHAPIPTQHRPDALVLFSSRESLGLALRSTDIILQCIARLTQSIEEEQSPLTPFISSYNSSRQYGLQQVALRNGPQLRDNLAVTYDLLVEAETNSTCPPIPAYPEDVLGEEMESHLNIDPHAQSANSSSSNTDNCGRNSSATHHTSADDITHSSNANPATLSTSTTNSSNSNGNGRSLLLSSTGSMEVDLANPYHDLPPPTNGRAQRSETPNTKRQRLERENAAGAAVPA